MEIKDSKYHISLKYKLETRTREESIKTIIRTDEHIVWLLQSFEAERKLIIVPKFKSKSYLSSLAELITVSGDIRELQRTSEKIFMERMVTRLLNILVQVCLVLLNDYSVESTRPLFLFINERF